MNINKVKSGSDATPAVELVPVQEVVQSDSGYVDPVASTTYERKPTIGMSYLAPGAVWEGTLTAIGAVEVAGKFIGELTTKGTAILRADVQGTVTANNLVVSGCTLTGDAVVAESIVIKPDSAIKGNVRAKELRSAGQIIGDLKISGEAALGSTARVKGDIIAGDLSVAKGAAFSGSVEINRDMRFED